MTRRVILDASSNNGDVDFAAIKAAHPEVVGLIAKATEGNSYVNPLFHRQITRAREAGLLTGAYGFMHPSNAGTADVDKLLGMVENVPLELGLWLDNEITDGLDPGTVSDRFHEDATEADRRTGHRVGIYTGRWFWDPQTRGSGWASGLPAWIANYSGAGPNIPFPWTHAMMWQFTDKYAAAPGVSLDGSVWTGLESDWTTWTREPTPIPVVDPLAAVKATQQIVHAVPDGKWARDTDRRCESLRLMRDPMNVHNPLLVRAAQDTLEVAVDGDWGDKSSSAWTSSVKKLQRTWGVDPDGEWGRQTDSAYLAISPTR